MIKSPNLFLHCGGEAVETHELKTVVLPPETRSYKPVGHDVVLGLAEEALGDMGFNFGIQAHGLAAKGQRYFGLVHLLHESMNEQHALVMGIRNSLDKTFPAALAFGSCVFVCDNLAFTGDVTVSRKHTTNIMRDLPGLVRSAVEHTAVMSDVQDQRFEHYAKRTIQSDEFAHNLIAEMYRRGAVNTSRIGKVIDEYHEPSHDEFTEGGHTYWRLFNAATEALKGAPLHDMPGRTIELQALMDEASEFKPRVKALAAA